MTKQPKVTTKQILAVLAITDPFTPAELAMTDDELLKALGA